MNEDNNKDVFITDEENDKIIIINNNSMEIDDDLDESPNKNGSNIELESLEDSDYDSDSSDKLIQNKHRNLNLTKIITLDQTKICSVSYYYMENYLLPKYCNFYYLNIV